jgi:lysophospholipase L1-like esterase
MKYKLYLIVFLFCEVVYGQPLFKHHDKVCFVGNSITHNGRYHSYIYLFYATRFPEMHLSFINAGISGDTGEGMLKRLEEDVLSNNATVVTLSAGMNDVRRSLYSTLKPVDNAEALKREAINNYRDNVIKIAEFYKKHQLRPIFFTPTIYDENVDSSVESLKGVNAALGECREIIMQAGRDYHATVIDFWKPMCDINDSIQQSDKSFTLTREDRIHPQATGHLVMAYLFLKQIDFPKEVWTLSFDTKKKRRKLQYRCEMFNMKSNSQRVTFLNKEFALPFPRVAEARDAYNIVPVDESFNQQILKIDNLKDGKYCLLINDVEVGEFSSIDFKKGINLATNYRTPQYAISDSIAKLCEDYFLKGSVLRTLRRVEIYQLNKINIEDKEGVKDYLNKYIEEMQIKYDNGVPNTGYYINTAKTYLKEFENKEIIKADMKAIEKLIYTLNQPRIYNYEIIKI